MLEQKDQIYEISFPIKEMAMLCDALMCVPCLCEMQCCCARAAEDSKCNLVEKFSIGIAVLSALSLCLEFQGVPIHESRKIGLIVMGASSLVFGVSRLARCYFNRHAEQQPRFARSNPSYDAV